MRLKARNKKRHISNEDSRNLNEKHLEDFYTILAKTHYRSNVHFDGFLMLDSIISNTFQSILNDHVELVDNPSQDAVRLASDFDTKRAGRVSVTKKGHSTLSILSHPLNSVMYLSRCEDLAMGRSRRSIMNKAFYTASSTQSYFAGNAHFFIWWDISSSRGFFIKPPKVTKFENVELSEIGRTMTTIIICHRSTLNEKRTLKLVRKHTGFAYANGVFHISSYPVLGTKLDLGKADMFCKFLMSQKTTSFRRHFLSLTNDLLRENVVWNLAFNCSAQLRENTIKQYLGHIRSFAFFDNNKPVREVFEEMRQTKIDDNKIAQWLRHRIGYVEIDTVIQGINAFVWFYKRFTRKDKVDFHDEAFTEIQRLRKRLRKESDGSADVSWSTMRKLLKQIFTHDWGKFHQQDIFDLAVISLWGALRISESCDLSAETTNVNTFEDLLKITIWDAKSVKGTEPQWKFVSAFPTHKDFCPIQAHSRLSQKTSSGLLVRDSNGKALTSTKLSTMFRKFVLKLKHNGTLDKDKQFTWHLFRISYLNIGFHEFGMPIYYSQATACHEAIQSTRGYVARTRYKRRKEAATNFAAQAAKHMISESDDELLHRICHS